MLLKPSGVVYIGYASRSKVVLPLIIIVLLVLCAGTAIAGLEIQDFDLDSEGDDELVKPGEELTVKFDVVNTGSYDLEDVEAELWFEEGGSKLEDNNGDNINPEFDLRDLDEGDSKNVKYTFKIPWEVEDTERYDIFVKVKAKNASNNNRESIEEKLGKFRVEKENHELMIKTHFEPQKVDCGGDARLYVSVRNIGSNNEDDINLTAINTLIGVNAREFFYLDKDFDDENLFEKSYPFTVKENLNPGMYELTVRVEYDRGYRKQHKTTNITVESCDFTPQDEQSQDSGQDTESPNQTGQEAGNDSREKESSQDSISYVPAKPSGGQKAAKDDSIDNMTILLIVLGELALIIILMLAYLLFRTGKKPRKPEMQEKLGA